MRQFARTNFCDFDISEGIPNPTLGFQGGKGGLSGQAIFHIALTDVADLAKHLKIPVVGCGGISDAEDVIKMLMAGARAVEIYTAAHLKGDNAPVFLDKIINNVELWLRKHGYSSIRQVHGLALSLLDIKNQMTPLVPKLKPELCIGCGLCETICIEPDIISMIASESSLQNKRGRIPLINEDTCIGCGACTSVCPTDALPVSFPTQRKPL